MGKTTIEWCHWTFNPWTGCTRVSEGCVNCYAEAFDRRVGGAHWGHDAERQTRVPAYWKQPYLWDHAAEAAGERRRVFCASMADVFEDRPGLQSIRQDLWRLIESTQNLDWLLLTKRPENFARMLPWLSGNDCTCGGTDIGVGVMHEPGCGELEPWPNVWLGVSAENQDRADQRIPILLETPAAIRFVSAEPLLGPISLGLNLGVPLADGTRWGGSKPLLDWVIVGAESGPRARPMDLAWARSLRDQCAATGVPFMLKQTAERGRKLSLPVLDGRRWAEVPT
jgi:protein gp37